MLDRASSPMTHFVFFCFGRGEKRKERRWLWPVVYFLGGMEGRAVPHATCTPFARARLEEPEGRPRHPADRSVLLRQSGWMDRRKEGRNERTKGGWKETKEVFILLDGLERKLLALHGFAFFLFYWRDDSLTRQHVFGLDWIGLDWIGGGKRLTRNCFFEYFIVERKNNLPCFLGGFWTR